MARLVLIHYLRPPGRRDVFHQHLVHDGEDVKVTFATDLTFEPPVTVDGETVLETGSEVVWFTFPGEWHDIGRFHTADGQFRGWYANVLTPPVFEAGDVWRTTDLFLDVWLPAEGGEPKLLDRDQLDEALEEGWIGGATGKRALREGERIIAACRRGRWPPEVTKEWTRERARAALDAA